MDGESTELLLSDIGITPIDGETDLYTAIRWNLIGETKRLISEGYDINIQNKHGYTPLHIASIIGIYSIAKILIDAGADIEKKCKLGWTALHFSCFNRNNEQQSINSMNYGGNHDSIISLLIRSNCNLDVQVSGGITPICIAAQKGDWVIYEMLKIAGANPFISTNHGTSILDFVFYLDSKEDEDLLNNSNIGYSRIAMSFLEQAFMDFKIEKEEDKIEEPSQKVRKTIR